MSSVPGIREFLLGLAPGRIVEGTIDGVHHFGAFVRLDGEPSGAACGFLNPAELTWSHIRHPADAVAPGDRVTVEVLAVDLDREQAAVSRKALEPDPFPPLVARIGEVVAGPVTIVLPFGVFVRVADGLTGLLPTAEVAARMVPGAETDPQLVGLAPSGGFPASVTGLRPGERVDVGDLRRVRIADVDVVRHRILLSGAE